jgi:hypothetical protein
METPKYYMAIVIFILFWMGLSGVVDIFICFIHQEYNVHKIVSYTILLILCTLLILMLDLKK